MRRILRFNQGIISGEDKEILLQILPQLENSFRQRKQYYEYYFDRTELELSLATIDEISSEFVIVLNYEELIINL